MLSYSLSGSHTWFVLLEFAPLVQDAEPLGSMGTTEKAVISDPVKVVPSDLPK